MTQAQPRVLPKHAWSGEAHHGLDLLAPVSLIAMNRAFGARRLFFPEATPIQAEANVILQLLALGTKTPAVVMTAVDAEHGGHGLPLARQAGFGGLGFVFGPGQCSGCIHDDYTFQLRRRRQHRFDTGQGLAVLAFSAAKHLTANELERNLLERRCPHLRVSSRLELAGSLS